MLTWWWLLLLLVAIARLLLLLVLRGWGLLLKHVVLTRAVAEARHAAMLTKLS